MAADGDGPVVGFVGRIEPRKGPLDLVHAAPAIRAARARRRGSSSSATTRTTPSPRTPRRSARAAGVEHYRWVARGAAVMRHLDVLVAPSRQEPFGTVLAEAMAAGTPVVATRVGGLAEVVDDGVTGRLVEPGDPTQLAAAVLEVLADRERDGRRRPRARAALRRRRLRRPRRAILLQAARDEGRLRQPPGARPARHRPLRALPARRRCARPRAATTRSSRPTARARVDVFHSPWIDGALLRPPCPQVVTLHDVVPLKRRSEYLRSGIRFRMRYLAVERATRVIVPTRGRRRGRRRAPRHRAATGSPSSPRRPRRRCTPRGAEEVAAARKRYGLPEDYLLWVGGLQTPDPRKRVAALAEAPRELPLVLVGATSRGRTSCPT